MDRERAVGAWPDGGASPLLALALTARFFLELALLAGVVILAWQLADGRWRWVAAVAAVVTIAVVWGLFLSPKAAVPLPGGVALALESTLFVGICGGLLAVGFGAVAVIGLVIWSVDRAVLALLRY